MSNENDINFSSSVLDVTNDDATASTTTSALELGAHSPVPTATSAHEPVTDSPVATITSDHEPDTDEAHVSLRPRRSLRKPKKITF